MMDLRLFSGTKLRTKLDTIMGHESIETTRIYLRRTASEQQELVDTVVTW